MFYRLLLSVTLLCSSFNLFAQTSSAYFKTYPFVQAGSSSSIAAATNGYLLAAYQPGQVELIRTDYSGQQLWRKTLNVPLNIYSLQRTADGGYLLSGAIGTTGAGLLKLDSAGTQQWSRTYGWVGAAAIQTADGGYALLANRNPSGFSLDSCCLYKTDAAGNVVWRLAVDSLVARCLVQTADGGIVMGGYGSTTPGWYSGLLKASPSGQLLWRKDHQTGMVDFGLGQLTELADQSLLMAGTGIPPNLISGAPMHPFVRKASATGDTLWTRYVSLPGTNLKSTGLLVMPNGHIITSADIEESGLFFNHYTVAARLTAAGQTLCSAMLGDGRGTPAHPGDTLLKRAGVYRTAEGQNLAPHPDGGFVMIGTIDSFRKATSTYLGTHLVLMKFDSACRYITAVPVATIPAAAAPFVYPNPSGGVFSVRAGAGAQGAAVLVVRDITGREVYRSSRAGLPGGVPLTLDLSRQPKGLYLLQVQTAAGNSSARLVVQ